MSAPVLTLSLRGDPASPALVLIGDLDVATAGLLHKATAQVAEGTTLLVALEKLAFLDVAGLNALLSLHRRLAPGGVVLRGAAPMTRRMIRLLGLEQVLPVLDPCEPMTSLDGCASS